MLCDRGSQLSRDPPDNIAGVYPPVNRTYGIRGIYGGFISNGILWDLSLSSGKRWHNNGKNTILNGTIHTFYGHFQ